MGELSEEEKTAGKPFFSHTVRPPGQASRDGGETMRYSPPLTLVNVVCRVLSFSTLSFVVDTFDAAVTILDNRFIMSKVEAARYTR